MPIPVSELQKINPSSVIELFTLTLDSTLHGSTDVQRFHAGSNNLNNGDVIWQGNIYQKFPCQAEVFEFDGAGGAIPRPTLTISNVLGTITTLFATVNAVTANMILMVQNL